MLNQIADDLICSFKKVRRSQVKTLLALVIGLIRGGTLGVAAIGRSMDGRALEKHRIKRVDRFLGNEKFNRMGVARALTRKLCASYSRVFVSIDWTDGEDGVHAFLEAALATESRGILIWTKAVAKKRLEGSQNRLEDEFVEELRELFPEDQEVVILADRGFHRVSFLRKLRILGFHYIIRLPCNLWMDSSSFKGSLGWITVKRGLFRDFGPVFLHKKERFGTRVILCFDQGHEEPWILATSTSFRLKRVVRAYGRRFTIEEANRDIKNERNGLRLRGVRLSSPRRLERLMLVVAVAYLLMVSAGIYGEKKRIHRRLMANTEKSRTLALWRIGQYVLNRMSGCNLDLAAWFPKLLFTG